MAYWAQKIATMFRTAFYHKAFLLLFFLASCAENKKEVLPYYNGPDFTPFFITDADVVASKIPHQIADFSFTDQHNKNISQHNIENKIHVANFIFTSCGSICPVMTKHMQQVSHAFWENNDVVLLSYSVTPWIDSVKTLKQYTKNQGIDDPNWHFLTGNKSHIYQLARQSYFAEESIGFSMDSTDFLHTEHFLLIDKSKRIRGIYNGTLPLEIKQLIEDIKQLKEA